MDPQTLLTQIQTQQQSAPLSILGLAEPLLQQQQQEQRQASQHSPSDRPSNASSSVHDSQHQPDLTPSALTADLAHYRDLFAKLRFSYSEQVTKERYLKSIVGDPPTLHTAEENAALEARVAVMKAELKEKKAECDRLVEEMEVEARRLAQRWEAVEEGRKVLGTVPAEVEELRRQVAEIREQVEVKRAEMGSEGEMEPRYTMGLEKTKEAVEQRRKENEEMDREIERLKSALETKGRECERVERELEETERRRNEVTRQAREVKRVREEGGRDFVGERGRWYDAQSTVMTGLLEV